MDVKKKVRTARNMCDRRTYLLVIKRLSAYPKTLAELAKAAGLSTSLVYKLSTGEKSSMSPESAAALLAAMGGE